MLELHSVQNDLFGTYEIHQQGEIEEICNEGYPFLVNDVLKYIEEIKISDNYENESLIEIIVQYSLNNKIDIRLIGDAISEDEYFKSFIKSDCEFRGSMDVVSNFMEW